MIMSIILFIIVIALLAMIISSTVRIVPQAHAYVVERLGAYQGTWSVGLHVKVPFIDRVARKVNLKEQVVDFHHSQLSQKITLRCRSIQLYIFRLLIQNYIVTV